jgi:RHS repeat-associated protein
VARDERWNYYYDTNPFDANYTQNGWGRLAAVEFGSAPNGPNRPRYMYSYNQAGRVTAQRLYVAQSRTTVDVAADYQWDTEGRMTSLTYPGQQDPVVQQYDVMGRLSAVGGVTAAYGPAGELTTLSYDGRTETRSYNVLGQLTRMRVTGQPCTGVPSVCADLSYNYPDGGNNGRISSMADNVSGEQVAYQYDELNRLVAAAGSGWSQAYQYDGFGNMTQQGAYQATYDAATNRETTTPYTYYDANGNVNSWSAGTASYDTENRMTRHTNSGVERLFGYDPWGKRLWKSRPATGQWEYYFYGVTGQKLADIKCLDDLEQCGVSGTLEYFGSRLVKENGQTVIPDRLGSVRRNGTGYYPYGEERTPTDDGRVKFATYSRELPGLDYADQRYYNASRARFWTPDPGGISTANASDPGSWNRYAYAGGDPINRLDPQGMDYIHVEEFMDCVNGVGPCRYYGDPTRDGNGGDPHSAGGGAVGRSGGGGGVGPSRESLFMSAAALAKNNFQKVSSSIRAAVHPDSVFSPQIVDCIAGLEATWDSNRDGVGAAQGRTGLFQYNEKTWNGEYGNKTPWSVTAARDVDTSVSVKLGGLAARLLIVQDRRPDLSTLDQQIARAITLSGDAARFGDAYGAAIMDCSRNIDKDFNAAFRPIWDLLNK